LIESLNHKIAIAYKIIGTLGWGTSIALMFILTIKIASHFQWGESLTLAEHTHPEFNSIKTTEQQNYTII
jgi:hypothetical protein